MSCRNDKRHRDIAEHAPSPISTRQGCNAVLDRLLEIPSFGNDVPSCADVFNEVFTTRLAQSRGQHPFNPETATFVKTAAATERDYADVA